MAAITWKASASGLWSNGNDWIGGVAPGGGDTAVFNATTIDPQFNDVAPNRPTIDAGTTLSVQDIVSADGVQTEAVLLGTLDLAGTLTLGNGSPLALYDGSGHPSGEIVGGTIDLGANFASLSGGTVDGVTVTGSAGTGVYAFTPAIILGGLTLTGPLPALALGGDFVGDQTIGFVTAQTDLLNLGGSVTLAAGGVLTNAGGLALFVQDDGSGLGALVNDGTIADSNTLEAEIPLVNAGVIDLLGTYSNLSALANSGTMSLGAGAYVYMTGTITNSGLLALSTGATLQSEGLVNAGGTLSLDGGTLEGNFFGASTTMTGGLLVGGNATVAGNTLDGVSLAGSFAALNGIATPTTGFIALTPGVRAVATSEYGFGYTASATMADVDLTLVASFQTATLSSAGALTLAASTDIAVQLVNAGESPAVTAATALTLGGTIEAYAGRLALQSGSGGIVNTGTILTVAGETLAITANGSGFANQGVLSLAAGSVLDLTANVSAAGFTGLTAGGATLELAGTLSGSAAPGDGAVTLVAGSVVRTSGVIRDVTVYDDTATTAGGTLDGVTWQGNALDVTDRGVTVVRNGLAVHDAAGNSGAIVIGGDNSVLNFQSDTTLDNVAVTIGSTLVTPGSDTFSVIDGGNPTTGIDSSLTIGANASVAVTGNEAHNGLNNIGTLTVDGTIAFGVAPNAASLAPGAGASIPGEEMYAPYTMAQAMVREAGRIKTDEEIWAIEQRQSIEAENNIKVADAYAGYLNTLSALSHSLRAATPSVAFAATPSIGRPDDLALSNETTFEGTGAITVGNDAPMVLDAVVGAGLTLSFDPSSGIFVLLDPTHVTARITDFGVGDGIDLGFQAFAGGGVGYAGGQLVIPTAGGDFALNVQFAAGSSAADVVLVDDGDQGTFAYVACFAEGARIATPRGPAAVEALRPGDLVALAGGGSAPVVWTGHRRIDIARHPRPHDVRPVRVLAHAFGPGRPSRDLRLSPDHAVFADGALIPVRYLLNGASVAQERVERVAYWHVELASHDLLLAEGLAVESYLDTGNRAAFANGGAAIQAHPDFTRDAWDARSCAPLALSGPGVVAARAGLLARLPALGFAVTADPGLRVLADGVAVAAQDYGDWLCFALPDGVRTLRLLSRDAAPADLDPESDDTRRLGVAVTGLRLDGAPLALTDPRLLAGWHKPEPGLRWTAGDATLRGDGAGVLELSLARGLLRYGERCDANRNGDRAYG